MDLAGNTGIHLLFTGCLLKKKKKIYVFFSPTKLSLTAHFFFLMFKIFFATLVGLLAWIMGKKYERARKRLRNLLLINLGV